MANKTRDTASRVLIYRLGSLGDTVVALPALHLVAKAFPNAERRLLTNFPVNVKAPPAVAILEHTGLVHGFIPYAVGTRSPRDLISLWWQLVRWRPQVVVYLASARGIASAKRDAAFFRLCGVRQLIGVPLTEEMQRNRLGPDQVLEPEAERLARNIAVLGDAALDEPSSWDLRLTAEERRRAAEALEPLGTRRVVALSVGTKRQSKDWGKENWRALLARMAELYPEYSVALCGAEEEREASEYAAEGWRQSAAPKTANAIVNLCGSLSPRESAAVCERSRVFVGHDSGPMHLAAAVQTPCVAVFSARNRPKVWFPYGRRHRVIYHQVDCWGCNLETCIVEKKKCIDSIEVKEVLDAVRALIEESEGTGKRTG
ncbi:glycosyltransferase family 9 protein [Edaphobacter bradus]|uniref:glycosyltransferase family 9 protein n=1 Tax=Edaphobacter bradus TaxID=2259016 RepID=UPI0021DFBB17|nr:glycosyltransferase family 9 protein [Edaphobacter bradus]